MPGGRSQQGWATPGNGELLAAAEAEGFDIFVTTDKNLRYQQNLSGWRIAIIVVVDAQWPRLEAHVGRVVAAVDRAEPGSFSEVAIPAR